MSKPTAIIIGAGVAGLAAALRLGEGGRWRPMLLEREDRAGGLARSLHFQGVSTDLGPHRIHTELPEVEQLIERIAAPSLITVQRTSHIYLRGHYLRYPPAPLEMAMRLGPLRLAGFMASFAAERLRPAPPAARETYESLMRRAFGKRLYEFLLRPYSAKTWKIDPAELHADTARVRVSAGSLAKMVTGLFQRQPRGGETALKQFRYVRGGAETLVGYLWAYAQEGGAEMELRCSAHRLELDETNRVRGVSCVQDPAQPWPKPVPTAGEPPRVRYPGDVFLSTAPLPILLSELLPPVPALAEAREAASCLLYLNMIFVYLIVRRPNVSGDNWLYFPEPELIFNRVYEAKNFDPAMGPEDRTVLCVEITLRASSPVGRESDAALVAAVTEQLASTGLIRSEEVETGIVYRLPFAYPLYTLDYAERLDRALEGLRRIPNLMTVGRQGLFNHNNMDHSILMGLRAADQLNAQPAEAAVQGWYDAAHQFKTMRIVD